MDFIEITIPCMDTEDAEILMAELSDFPFEGFEATETTLKAYIGEQEMEANLQDITAILRATGAKCTCRTIENRNWNAEWESSFEPVTAGNVVVRAPFHEAPGDGVTDIVIMPKMSFGTGHHATTRLMIQLMEQAAFDGKKVLDMGSGTGILAILAAKMGAEAVDAVDIDEWAYENCNENIETNGVREKINPVLGDAGAIPGKDYGIILANINRNILSRDLGVYSKNLKKGGQIIISGILDTDLPHIDEAAEGAGLCRATEIFEQGWCGAAYREK